MKNILLTGKPKSGKTTLLNKLLEAIPNKVGLVTNEIREDGERVGFEAVTHSNERSLLAHVDFDKEKSVSRYGVSIENLEKLLPFISHFENETLYLDEIGQMELMSSAFIEITRNYLDSENLCLATFSCVYEDNFTKEVRNRDDVVIYEIDESNRDEMYKKILTEIELKKS